MDIDPWNDTPATHRECDHGEDTGSGHEIGARRPAEEVEELTARSEKEVEDKVMYDAEQSIEQERNVEEEVKSNARRLLGQQEIQCWGRWVMLSSSASWMMME